MTIALDMTNNVAREEIINGVDCAKKVNEGCISHPPEKLNKNVGKILFGRINLTKPSILESGGFKYTVGGFIADLG
jgi:hypothetical protein